MKVPASRSREELEVKMTPMIDVVFLLLVFFVWTSSFEKPEYDLPGAVAETPVGGSSENPVDTPPVESFDELVIRIAINNGSSTIELGGDPLSGIDELGERIKEVTNLGVQPPVIVDPDDDVTMDLAVNVYDVVRQSGADRVLFALTAKQSLAE